MPVTTNPGATAFHRDPVGRELARPALGEAGNGRLGRRVVRRPGTSSHGVDRGNVHDPAVFARRHPGHDGLGREERPAHVNLEHSVEILDGYFVDEEAPAPDPGIVDQDIDRPERVGRLLDAGLQGGDIPDVHPQRMGPAVPFAHHRRRFLDPVDDVVHDHVGAAFGEKKRMAAPHSAAGAGYQSNSTIE